MEKFRDIRVLWTWMVLLDLYMFVISKRLKAFINVVYQQWHDGDDCTTKEVVFVSLEDRL